jgi:hypothetical protein
MQDCKPQTGSYSWLLFSVQIRAFSYVDCCLLSAVCCWCWCRCRCRCRCWWLVPRHAGKWLISARKKRFPTCGGELLANMDCRQVVGFDNDSMPCSAPRPYIPTRIWALATPAKGRTECFADGGWRVADGMRMVDGPWSMASSSKGFPEPRQKMQWGSWWM